MATAITSSTLPSGFEPTPGDRSVVVVVDLEGLSVIGRDYKLGALQ